MLDPHYEEAPRDKREDFNNRLRGWTLILAAVATVIGLIVHEVRGNGYLRGNGVAIHQIDARPRWK